MIRHIPIGFRRYRNSWFILRRLAEVDAWVVIVWSLFLCVLFLYAVDSFVNAPGRDSGAFLYVAKGILDGEMPYIDRWDHKGPLIYIINVAAIVISDVWGIWLVQFGFLAGICLSASKLFRSQFGTTAMLFSLTVLLTYFDKFVEGGNLTEEYALLFSFLALCLFVRIERCDDTLRRVLAAGALGALGAASLLLRPNLVGVWVAIGVCWLIYWDDSARKFIWAGVGSTVVLLVVATWFTAAGGLSHFWDAVFVYNVAYSQFSLGKIYPSARYSFELFFPLNLVILLGWFVGLWYIREDSPHYPPTRIVSLAVILLPIELVFANLSGRQYWHYYLSLIPVTCLLSAFMIKLLLDALQTQFPWIPAGLLVFTGSLYAGLPANLIPDDIRKYANLTEIVCCRNPVINYIRENTDEDDRILVWGAEGSIYFISDRTAPTRFFYQYPLFTSGYNHDLIKEFTSDVSGSPPAIIIDTHNLSLSLNIADPERRYPENFNPFIEFVDTHYERAKTIGSNDVYHHKK